MAGAYKQGVKALNAQGWLTDDQASTLDDSPATPHPGPRGAEREYRGLLATAHPRRPA